MNSRPGATIFQDHNQGTVLEVLDALLEKGVVLHGEIILTVANIDLVFIGLHLVVASTATMLRQREAVSEEAA